MRDSRSVRAQRAESYGCSGARARPRPARRLAAVTAASERGAPWEETGTCAGPAGTREGTQRGRERTISSSGKGDERGTPVFAFATAGEENTQGPARVSRELLQSLLGSSDVRLGEITAANLILELVDRRRICNASESLLPAAARLLHLSPCRPSLTSSVFLPTPLSFQHIPL